jgi:EAL domain-containing protein (putative c-di-GMP-specific phosphodiesterase class I)
MVAEALARTGAHPSALVLEVTEGGILHEGHDSTHAIEGLRELGVKISIDDFGTGYSSMSRLRNLPIGELKIDRSFISTFEQDAGSRAIVEATLTLAQQLGLETVAEGVEEESTLIELRRLGVDQIQGYYYSPALPIDTLWEWIAEHEGRAGLRAAG